MASLIQVRDLLALRGRMEAAQISQTLNTPQPMINAMLKQLESREKQCGFRKNLTAVFPAVVKAARKEKPVCTNGGRCVNLVSLPVLKARYAFASGLFCVRLSIKMQPLQRDVSSSESVSQG